MGGFLVSFLVGVLCIILGINNMKGNISSIHSYHRSRVSEEDRIPFGKGVGLGTVIIGVAIILFSILSALSVAMGNDVFDLIGTGIMILGIVIGMIISFAAMKKYNNGIF